jgi:hypothetical protein
MEQNPRYLKKN